MANDMSLKDRVSELRETTVKLAAMVNDPDHGDATFDNYLSWIANFHKYSLHNILLIWSQCPHASQVAGYKTWAKLGRQVRKGEKGLTIFIPMRTKPKEDVPEEEQKPGRLFFGIGHVFDISQTDGPEVTMNFKMDLGEAAESLLLNAQKYAAAEHLTVKFEELGSANGSASAGVITLNSSRPNGILAQTIIHELAPQLLHIMPTKEETDRSLREGEAEAVCVVVMRHYGFDTMSNGAAYIKNHEADGDTILRSLDRITKTAKTIIEGLDA